MVWPLSSASGFNSIGGVDPEASPRGADELALNPCWFFVNRVRQ